MLHAYNNGFCINRNTDFEAISNPFIVLMIFPKRWGPLKPSTHEIPIRRLRHSWSGLLSVTEHMFIPKWATHSCLGAQKSFHETGAIIQLHIRAVRCSYDGANKASNENSHGTGQTTHLISSKYEWIVIKKGVTITFQLFNILLFCPGSTHINYNILRIWIVGH